MRQMAVVGWEELVGLLQAKLESYDPVVQELAKKKLLSELDLQSISLRG